MMDTHQHDPWTRRGFIKVSAAALAGTASGRLTNPAEGRAVDQQRTAGPATPTVIASANGLAAVKKAMARLREKADPLDAVIEGVNIVENDPEDTSVGLGGLPNEDGVVELDSCCMHGPTHKAGGVAALRNIKNPSQVARLVMQRTDHVLIVGEGALRFARAHGFKEENLLTDKSRKAWLQWKEDLSDRDDWLSPTQIDGTSKASLSPPIEYTWGTINCCAVDASSNLAGVTTTSGLSYKIPGRVGDSPIIGAGLYVDNEVGAAGSTGRGESNLQNCSSFQIVESMRAGKSPEQACLEVLKHVVRHTEPRLLDKAGRPRFNLKFYAVAKDGRYGSASMWSGAEFAVHDGVRDQIKEAAYLYEKDA